MENIPQKTIYTLLKIVFQNGNVVRLIDQGYTYAQINNLLNTLIDENYLYYDNQYILKLALSGKKFIEEYEKEHHIKVYAKYIEHKSEYWADPIDQFQIYIPKKTTHFKQ
ncbi:MAG: hypothetical protein ACC608_07040 [Anaerofustis sp.]